MSENILVTYGTWAGSTREVAEAIGDALHDQGAAVDVVRAKQVTDVTLYDGVVVGTAVRAGKLHRSVRRFVKKNRQALSQRPVAYFVACGNMVEDTPQNREETMGYLKPLLEGVPEIEPVDIGLFAGAILTEGEDFERQFCLFKMMMRAMESQFDDSRDWEAIRAWARDLWSKFQGGQ